MAETEVKLVNKNKGLAVNFARGRAGELASALGYDRLGKLSSKDRKVIFQFVLRQWAAAAKAALTPEKATRYGDGIVPRNMAGDPNKIEWALQGFDALSLEFGWAPPDGRNKHRNDGLGEWDGAVHDMRSYMLTTGNPGVKISTSDSGGSRPGTRYLLVPFHENRRVRALAKDIKAPDEFKEALADLKVGGILDKSATANMEAESRKIRSRLFIGPLRRKGGHIIPPSESEGRMQRLTSKHSHSKYSRAIRNYADVTPGDVIARDRGKEARAPRTKGSGRAVGFRFTFIRTITDDLSGSRTWMTTGNPPVELLQLVRKEAARAITNVLAGRDPGDDG